MKRSSRAGRLTQLERNQRTTGIFFILPSLVLCAIFMVVPLINVIRYSLTDWDGLSKTYNFVGLYNYMPVSYTHLDVYKRQPCCRHSRRRP